MKKQATFQIAIPEPCHENWEAMTAVEKGRFCSNCQKVVTDFSEMEDAEMLQIMHEGKSLCGRFRTEQLNRPLQMPLPKVKQFFTPLYQRIAASLLIVAAFGEKTFAQQSKTPTTQQPSAANKKASSTAIISGHLLDMETQKPLAGVSIYLIKEGVFTFYTETNRWGGFTFDIPPHYQIGKGVLSIEPSVSDYIVVDEEVSLSATNTKVEMYRIKQERLEKVKVIAYKQPSPVHTMGVIENPTIKLSGVSHLIDKKPSFWHRITHPFKKKK